MNEVCILYSLSAINSLSAWFSVEYWLIDLTFRISVFLTIVFHIVFVACLLAPPFPFPFQPSLRTAKDRKVTPDPIDDRKFHE
jgi:hypothetical protein